jgi:hypothetical protein
MGTSGKGEGAGYAVLCKLYDLRRAEKEKPPLTHKEQEQTKQI